MAPKRNKKLSKPPSKNNSSTSGTHSISNTPTKMSNKVNSTALAEPPKTWIDSFSVQNPKKRAFLRAFVQTGERKASAKAAKCHYMSHYDWLDADPNYAAAFAKAEVLAADLLEEEAARRAKRGSDLLTIFLLKGLKPHRYREHVQVDGKVTLDLGELVNQSMKKPEPPPIRIDATVQETTQPSNKPKEITQNADGTAVQELRQAGQGPRHDQERSA